MHLVSIALAPAIALVWYIYASAAYAPTRRSLLALLFLAGGVSALGALFLNHLIEKYTVLWSGAPLWQHRVSFWMVGVGLNEEFVKMAVLLVLLYPRRDFTTPYQGLLGAATVALGFAAVENLFYSERYGTITLLTRSVLTIPAHAFFTIPMGVLMARSKRAGSGLAKYLWLVAGLGVAMVFHGSYDIWLTFDQLWINRLAYLQVVLMGLLALRWMRLYGGAEQGTTA